MNRIFIRNIFIAMVVLFTESCKNFKGFTIEGNVKNADQVKVYLEDISSEQPVIIDTATIRNAIFNLKGYAVNGIYRLRFGENMNDVVFIYLEEKDKLNIQADLLQLNQYKVEGNEASSSIQQLIVQSQIKLTELDSTYSKFKNANVSSKDSLQKIFELTKSNYVDYIKNKVKEEKNNDVACFALNFLGPLMQDEIPYLIDITDKLHTASPKSKYITNWYNSMQQYKEAVLEQNKGGVAENSEAPNIILPTPDGDTVQLKNLRGNYVLVDFWASWCQPCRMENPNVVAAYKKYHPKGFEVFSVSLDANKDQWIKAIQKDGLIWKYHGCDLGGWQSVPAQLYRVDAIPSAFLLDKTGKVIARNLRGEELFKKLEELYSSEAVN